MKIKKHIPVILAVCAAAAVFGGCSTEDTKEYDALNEKLNFNYSKIVLTVTNTIDEESVLTSEYVMKFSDGGMTVNYSVERFAELSLDSVASEKYTFVGEANIAGGKVTYVSGDEVNLDALTAGTGLNFKNDYFENVDLTDVYIKADVKDPSGFMGSPLTCTDMKVEASFLQIFYNIQITYLAQNGNRVKYIYAFSR